MIASKSPHSQLQKLQLWSLLIGVAGAVAVAIGVMLDLDQALRSYWFACLYWWEIAVGCLGVAMLFHLVGGRWGMATRPYFEAGARTLPLILLLMIPVAFRLDAVFPWADPEWTSRHTLGANRRLYFDKAFFFIRAIGYFAFWIAFAFLFSRRRTRSGEAMPEPVPRMGKTSAAGLVLFVATVTFAAVDWIMALDPLFKSTIFGGIFVVGAGLSGMAVVVACAALFAGQPTLPVEEERGELLIDLGNLLLAFLMLWTYFEFSQFLIIWMGNLPEEAVWYVHRGERGWGVLALVIAIAHFALPFLALLSRDVKGEPSRLGMVALFILFMHLVVLFWTVMPFWYHSGLTVHWLDVVAPLAVGGLWLSLFAWLVRPRLAAIPPVY